MTLPTNANPRLWSLVTRLHSCTGERDMYPVLRDMLIDPRLGIRLGANNIVVDTNLVGRSAAPDLAIYSQANAKAVRTLEYLYAVIEAKPGDTAARDPDQVLRQKQHYLQVGLRWFYIVDQDSVARRDLDAEQPVWEQVRWTELVNRDAFISMFGPVSAGEIDLERQMQAFEAGRIRYAHRNVRRIGRKAFIGTIREVARLLDEAVGVVVQTRVAPSVAAGLALVAEMESRWGTPQYRWDASAGHPIEFQRFNDRGRPLRLGAADAARYATDHAAFAQKVEPHLRALRIELVALPVYVAKMGLDGASLAATDKKSKRVAATFAYETASLVLSRMLMVRFSEDHHFLKRQISNGGVAAFASYASYFTAPYQALLAQAYRSARELYSSLFDPQGLDWILETNAKVLSDAIRRAMYLLARWDFRTVRGDILSGVYDHYLDVEKRRDLGEVFTRPEIARYVLDACGWDRSKTLLDPACGTGTFLVEALSVEISRLRAAGAFDAQAAAEILSKLNGLDINPFSVSLSQIQILWHLMELFEDRPTGEVREAASALLPQIRVAGGTSSLDTMGMPMAVGDQGAMDVEVGGDLVGSRLLHNHPPRYREINGGSYDVVVGNPPYVRASRRAGNALSGDYDRVATEGFDLYVPFLYRSLVWWLKPGGRMGMVVPMAVLDAGYAEAIRAVIAEHRLIEIVDLELLRKKTFHGVKRPAVVLVVERTPASPGDVVTVTTVPATAYDADEDHVDMSRAVKRQVPRRDLDQSRWLPQAFLADPWWRSLIEIATGTGTDICVKVEAGDTQVLSVMAEARRLAEDIEIAWVQKSDRSQVRVDLPLEDTRGYKPVLLLQYGIKFGGTAAFAGNDDNPAVYKALNIFPGRLLGKPTGHWRVGAEQDVRIYKYRSVFAPDRMYALRELSQVPMATPIPEGVVFQNTAQILMLRRPFPLNIWLLSRIIQFYAAKVLRGSVIEDLTAHWYKRQICCVPMPHDCSDAYLAELQAAGNALIEADRRIANEHERLDAVVARGATTLRNLLLVTAPIAAGGSVGGLPITPELVAAGGVAETAQGVSVGAHAAVVPDPDLRRWMAYLLTRLVEEGQTEIGRATLLDMPVPDDMSAAIAELDQLKADDPGEVFARTARQLDLVVGRGLGLSENQVDYVVDRMTGDSFLKELAPVWEKRGLSAQRYSPGEEQD